MLAAALYAKGATLTPTVKLGAEKRTRTKETEPTKTKSRLEKAATVAPL